MLTECDVCRQERGIHVSLIKLTGVVDAYVCPLCGKLYLTDNYVLSTK